MSWSSCISFFTSPEFVDISRDLLISERSRRAILLELITAATSFCNARSHKGKVQLCKHSALLECGLFIVKVFEFLQRGIHRGKRVPFKSEGLAFSAVVFVTTASAVIWHVTAGSCIVKHAQKQFVTDSFARSHIVIFRVHGIKPFIVIMKRGLFNYRICVGNKKGYTACRILERQFTSLFIACVWLFAFGFKILFWSAFKFVAKGTVKASHRAKSTFKRGFGNAFIVWTH